MLCLVFCTFKKVLQIPDSDYNSPNYASAMEYHIASLFDKAMERERNSIMGRWNAARRRRRAATVNRVTVQARVVFVVQSLA